MVSVTRTSPEPQLQEPFTHTLRNLRRCFLIAAQLQMLLQDLLDLLADIGVWNEEGDTPMQADIRECPGRAETPISLNSGIYLTSYLGSYYILRYIP